MLTSLADTANALSFSETTKSDLDSYSDSSSIASRSYVAGLGQLELSPIIQVETSALSANAILSLTWQDSASRLWAGGTSGAGGLVLAWRRTPAGLWEAVNFGDTLGANARSMPVLVSLNNTLYGGISLNLNGGDNCGRLVRWNEGLDTWVLHLNLNASDGDFDGFGRGKMIWNNTAYMSGGRTNNKTFLVSLDGATGDVDFRSLENPRPSGAVAGEYDGALCGFGTYLYTGQERLFYAPLNARAGADVARAKEYGTFPTHIAQLDADNEMEVVQMARLNQSGIGDTLFLLLEGNVAANNVIYTTTDGNSFTGKISKDALGYSGTFGSGGLGVTEAFAMRQFGRDIWIGGTLDTVVRYVGDYDTFVHFFNSNMTSGIREFEYFRGLDGDTWLAIAGANGGGGRIDRFRFSDSGTYISDTRILASDTWLVADSVTINAKANGCTILVSYYFGRDTAELNTRTYGETFSVIGDSRGSFSFDFSHPLPSGRASGNAWKQMLYRVYMQTPNTLITPYFEGLTFYFHQDVTAPETPVVLTPAENHDTNNRRPLFSWTSSEDTVNGTLESGFDTFLLELDTGLSGAFASPLVFTCQPDSVSYLPISDLGADTYYLWRVSAFDTAENFSVSDTRRLTVDITPPIPVDTAIMPLDFADTINQTLVLRWSSTSDTLSGLSYYIVQMESGIAPSFTSPETWSVIAPDTFLSVGTLGISRSDTYYWRVIAYDSATNSSTSAIFAFRIRTQGNLSLKDSVGASASSFTVLDTITVELSDSDRNLSPSVPDSMTVVLTSKIGSDTKTILLTESDSNSDIFRGYIQLSDTSEVGMLLVGVGDTVTVTYTDSLFPFTPIESDSEEALITLFARDGSITFDSQSAAAIFDSPAITLADADRNRNPHANDTVFVTFQNTLRNDTETILLTETTDTSGIFKGGGNVWISDTIGVNPNDSILICGVGDIIRIYYQDEFDANDTGYDTVLIIRFSRASSLLAVDSAGSSIDSSAPGDSLFAIITDPDANLDPFANDTVLLTIRNLQTGETETAILFETTDTSGIFGPDTGTPTSQIPADSVSGNDTVYVIAGKTIRFEYSDAGNSSDTSADTIRIFFRETLASLELTDSTGGLISSLDRDSIVWSTVTDTDRDIDGLIKDTLLAVIRSLRGGDAETITLTESNLSSGIFQNISGLKISDTVSAVEGNLLLSVMPAYDTVRVEYQDGVGMIFDTVDFVFVRSVATLSLINKLGNPSNQYTPGDSISARVSDPDQNSEVAKEGSQETVIVTVTNTRVNDSETILLLESANYSGRFDSTTGIFTQADPAESIPGNGVIFAVAGDTLVLRYEDPFDSADSIEIVVIAASAPSWSSASLTDSTGVVTETYIIGADPVFATVTDTDENLYPSLADQIQATVWCSATGDSETILLDEIGPDSNIFRNAAGLRISDTEGATTNDGILLAGRRDTIQLLYTDATDPSDSVSANADVRADSTSSTSNFDSSNYLAPGSASLSILDLDRNFKPMSAETVTLLITSTSTNDTEWLVATETGIRSGIFACTIPISTFNGFSSNDGTLLVAVGDIIRFDYSDTENDGTDTSFDTANISSASTASSLSLLDSSLNSANTLLRGETMTALLIDSDVNQNPLLLETVPITFSNLRTGETETLLLFESGTASARFDSSYGIILSDSSADSIIQNGRLFALHGDTIEASYTQGADTSVKSALVVPLASQALMTLTDAAGISRDTYSVGGDSVFVTITDTDRNRSGTAFETVTVLLQILRTADSETIVLTEVSSDSNYFSSAGIVIADTAAVEAGDGILVAGVNDTILASYTDSVNGDTSSDTADIILFPRASSIRIINSVGADVSNLLTNDSVRIEVRDPNANRDPISIDSLAAIIRNPQTGETEPLTLFETGIYSGVFRFDTGIEISTNPLDSVSASGKIYAVSNDVLYSEYSDAYSATDTSFDTVLIRPAPTASEISFTDSNGASLSSYRTDSLVFVTLLDTDQNANGTAVETSTLIVYCIATGDTETVNVTELNVNSSYFRNVAGLPLSDTTGSSPYDGILFTGVIFELKARYIDPFDATDTSSDTAGLTRKPSQSQLLLDRTSYATETRVFITVVDTDRNRNPIVKDSFSVIARSLNRNDTESITLTENTETAGIFTTSTGLRISDTTGFSEYDGILLTALGDTFVIAYSDAYDGNDTAEFSAGVDTLNTSASVSYDSANYRVIDSVTITVIDRDKNPDPRIKDSITIEVINTRNSDTESLVLSESDSASFTFSSNALVLSDTGAETPNDGVMRVNSGDTILARFVDFIYFDTSTAVATITPRPTSASVSLSRDSVTNGETLIVYVTDNDRNISAYSTETILLREILVRAPLGLVVDNEFQTIQLVETTETSGIFASPPITFLSDVDPTSNDTKLLIGYNHTIEIDYRDTQNGDIASGNATINWFTDSSVSVLDRSVYIVGHTVYAAVTDTDNNRKPLDKDTVTLTVSNIVTGESEIRIGYESSQRSGYFSDTEGVLLTSNAADSLTMNGKIWARTGDTIQVDYTDFYDATDTSKASAGVGTTPDTTWASAIFTNSGGVSIAQFRMDSYVYVLLTDTDQNIDGTIFETAYVDVYDPATGDSEKIQLTELAADSGVFINSVGLRISDTTGYLINDGVLLTGAVLEIELFYQDPVRSSDSTTDSASLTRKPTISTAQLDRASYAPETFVYITISDLDRNRSPLVKDTITVSLISLNQLDTETLQLNETTETSGVFTNSTGFRISDTLGFAVSDGILLTALGDTFSVNYIDDYDASDTSESSSSVTLLLTSGVASFDLTTYTLNDSVVITVIDRDRNNSPRTFDSLGVSVRNLRTSDSETLNPVENDSASFTFVNSSLVLTDTGAALPGDGKLRVGNGDSIILSYIDPVNSDTYETYSWIGVTPYQAQIVLSSDTLSVNGILYVTVEDHDRNLDQLLRETIVLRRIDVVDFDSNVVENEFQTIVMEETTELP